MDIKKTITGILASLQDGVKAAVTRWNSEGVRLPFARSGAQGKPSVTLLIVYISSVVFLASLFHMHAYPALWEPTAMAMAWWAFSMVFYLMRTMQKFKVDLDDRSVEIEGGAKDHE